MHNDPRRITLVARHPAKSERDWDFSNPLGSRLVFVDSMSFLPFAIERGIEVGHDVERVIIDRTASAEEYLQLIASLPRDFVGDVLFVSDNGRGFLSSPGRGDGRVLYSFNDRDLNFYLNTHGLLWASFPGELRLTRLALA